MNAQPTITDPWQIVNLVMRELAATGVKQEFGPDINLRDAARAAEALLTAMGVTPTDAA